MTIPTTAHDPGGRAKPRCWMADVFAQASAEVASWPEHKRAAMREAIRPSVDPCRCHDLCEAAQTCVGGCVDA